MSLRSRLACIFAALAIASIAVTSFFAREMAMDALHNAAQRQLSQAAQLMSERLAIHMSERLNDIVMTSALWERLPAADQTVRRSYLDDLKATTANYAWIGLADLTGHVVVASGGILEGADVSARPWFDAGQRSPAALDVHEAKLLARYVPSTDGEPVRFVDVTAPVHGASGAVDGVLAAHLSWNWAAEVRHDILSTLADLAQSDLMVISENGEVLLGPHSLLGKTFVTPDPAIELFAAAHVPSMGAFGGLGWTVVARQPVDAALAPMAWLDHALLGAVLVLTLLAALAGWRIAGWIARPLTLLAASAEAVRAGAAIESLPTGRFREARQLSNAVASAFCRLRQSEAELRSVNATLEDRVAQRTRELEAARARAEAAATAKSDFLATMSHELRSPLNSIIGFADVMLDAANLPAEAERRLRLIRTSGDALKTVVDDVLDWSKVEAGKLQLQPQPFDLRRLAETSLAIVGVQAQAKGLTLSADIDPGLPLHVAGDEGRLRQVLLNLLNNAVKFTPGGSVTLSLRQGAGDAIVVAVVDTGIGMTAEQRGRLFQRFAQADGSIERRFGGTGLGLAISQKLVNLMGGEITVASEPDRGSCFSFVVALPAAAPADATPAADAPPAADAASAATRHGRILVVDDLAVNREIAAAMLEMAGHDVVTCAGGAEALELLPAGRFDLVLMDVQMPEMDGIEATRRVRQLPGAVARTPVVALTANVIPEEITRFRAGGMNDHVGKPIQREALLAVVDRWLGRNTPAVPEAPVDAAAFDRRIFSNLLALLGSARALQALTTLEAKLTALTVPDAALADLRRLAHTVVSLAGILGFNSLSAAARRLDAADDAADADAALQALRGSGVEAAAQIAALIAELREAAGAGDVQAKRVA
ncbi:ATP-binding protein [Aurantimonas sp. MSK8Z-1]|uniref:hybrid sensor histidine kinase/response regulator n=1 Tax=Mangrovibrevibacter kandeliae TaxID=2968473 RepID=UPI002117BA46|nr:ATP-binding protein [Aurantimonas sp. MSK8Z-1]MCW4113681.1 ATP-binding protein [Aurantimonas sp. MSK8Z-1]